LIEDLADLGCAMPPESTLPRLSCPASLLGTIYVLEGSRLGGRLLARSLAPDCPRRFMDDGEPRHWQSLVDVLDRTLVSNAEIDSAITAAKAAFALFEDGARREWKDFRVGIC